MGKCLKHVPYMGAVTHVLCVTPVTGRLQAECNTVKASSVLWAWPVEVVVWRRVNSIPITH